MRLNVKLWDGPMSQVAAKRVSVLANGLGEETRHTRGHGSRVCLECNLDADVACEYVWVAIWAALFIDDRP